MLGLGYRPNIVVLSKTPEGAKFLCEMVEKSGNISVYTTCDMADVHKVIAKISIDVVIVDCKDFGEDIEVISRNLPAQNTLDGSVIEYIAITGDSDQKMSANLSCQYVNKTVEYLGIAELLSGIFLK